MFWKFRRSSGSQPDNRQGVVDAMLSLNSYDWLVFTSANGVTAFFDLFFRHFHDLRDLGGAKIAAVGPATAAKLREMHLQVDAMPDEFIGKKIAERSTNIGSIENCKICLLRAQDGQSGFAAGPRRTRRHYGRYCRL